MIAVRAVVGTSRDHRGPVVPIVVPDLDDVRQAAARLHQQHVPWHGELYGWQAEYNPSRPARPLGSKMTFTPADFCIGESGIWFFSLLWEHGNEAQPVEFLDESAIVGNPLFEVQ